MIEPAPIAAALTAETDTPWSVALDRPVLALTGPDGAELILRPKDSRLHIAGAFGDAREHRPHYGGPAPGISVAIATAPDRIARAIVRRLLPTYLPELQAARAAQARHDAARDEARAVLDELLGMVGGARASGFEGYSYRGEPRRVILYPDFVGRGGALVSLEIGPVDVETARAVVALLAARRAA